MAFYGKVGIWGPAMAMVFVQPLRTVELWPEKKTTDKPCGSTYGWTCSCNWSYFWCEHFRVPGWTDQSCQYRISHIWYIHHIYIYIFMYILCVYHSSQVLPRVFVIKLLRWIISRCILSFWPTIWESIGISIWLLPRTSGIIYIYIYTSDPWKETTTDHTSPSHALTLWEILPTHSTNLLVMYVHHFWITFFTCNQLSIPQIWATPVASGGYLPREAAARQKPCFSPMIFNKRWNSSNLSFIRAVLL